MTEERKKKKWQGEFKLVDELLDFMANWDRI